MIGHLIALLTNPPTILYCTSGLTLHKPHARSTENKLRAVHTGGATGTGEASGCPGVPVLAVVILVCRVCVLCGMPPTSQDPFLFMLALAAPSPRRRCPPEPQTACCQGSLPHLARLSSSPPHSASRTSSTCMCATAQNPYRMADACPHFRFHFTTMIQPARWLPLHLLFVGAPHLQTSQII